MAPYNYGTGRNMKINLLTNMTTTTYVYTHLTVQAPITLQDIAEYYYNGASTDEVTIEKNKRLYKWYIVRQIIAIIANRQEPDTTIQEIAKKFDVEVDFDIIAMYETDISEHDFALFIYDSVEISREVFEDWMLQQGKSFFRRINNV